MGINKAIISGNLTRDPELRQTQSGMAVMSMGVAVNDRRKNQQTGEWEDRPNFIDCTMMGSRAQSIAPYLSKGTKVAIEGKLRWSQWEKDGQKRSKIEVVVDEIEFMSSRQVASPPRYGATGACSRLRRSSAYAAPQAAAHYAPQPYRTPREYQPAQYQQPSVYDDDIPF